MKLKADLFPYPVLSEVTDDYIKGDFKAECNVKQLSNSKMGLEVSFELNNLELQTLIKNNKAAFAVHVEGISSTYREMYVADNHESELSIQLDSKNINGSIEVNAVVIALTDIYNYSNSCFNPEYYDAEYKIKFLSHGDILAFVPFITFNFGMENNNNLNAQSMIRVTGTKKEFMSVDIDGDVILTKLPEKTFSSYKKLSNSNKATQDMVMITVILPTLVHVLNQIQSGVDAENKQWYISLRKLWEKLNYNDQTIRDVDALKLSQQLLDYPLVTAFDEYVKEREQNDD